MKICTVVYIIYYTLMFNFISINLYINLVYFILFYLPHFIASLFKGDYQCSNGVKVTRSMSLKEAMFTNYSPLFIKPKVTRGERPILVFIRFLSI